MRFAETRISRMLRSSNFVTATNKRNSHLLLVALCLCVQAAEAGLVSPELLRLTQKITAPHAGAKVKQISGLLPLMAVVQRGSLRGGGDRGEKLSRRVPPKPVCREPLMLKKIEHQRSGIELFPENSTRTE